MPKKLSHYDARGHARMVDVSSKARTAREAEASAFVLMTPEVLRALPKNPKGDPLEVARTAGIMAAKRTAELIPMCHPVAVSHIAVTLRVCENGVSITTKVRPWRRRVWRWSTGRGQRGALTVYDMCKALDKGIEIREVVLDGVGGKSGDFRRSTSRISMPLSSALHMSYTVSAATLAATSASISTPVSAMVLTFVVIETPFSHTRRVTAMCDTATGWHIGINSAVRSLP